MVWLHLTFYANSHNHFRIESKQKLFKQENVSAYTSDSTRITKKYSQTRSYRSRFFFFVRCKSVIFRLKGITRFMAFAKTCFRKKNKITSPGIARISFYFSGVASSTTMRQSFNYPTENGFCCDVNFGFWAFVYSLSLSLYLFLAPSFYFAFILKWRSHLSVWDTWQKAFNHCMVSLSPHCMVRLEYTQKHKHRKEKKKQN